MKYTLPQLDYYENLLALVDEGQHMLIGGSTGSGKSVALNSILYSVLAQPRNDSYIWIDTKRVELIQYRKLPQTRFYCQELCECRRALEWALEEIERRYKEMARNGERLYSDGAVYIVIDELSDLILNDDKKVFTSLLSKIARVGRAAKVLLICCTQNANRAILKAEIVSNLPTRMALHCNSVIESTQIIGNGDAYMLPAHGIAIVRSGASYYKQEIPLTSDTELRERIRVWTRQKNIIVRMLTRFGF